MNYQIGAKARSHDKEAELRDIDTILSQHFLFGQLPAEEREKLRHVAIVRHYEKNQQIFGKGEPGSSVIAVTRGCVRICAHTLDGRQFVLNIISAGEIFGEIACLDGGERTADAYAMEDATLVTINRRDFLPLLDRNPRIAIKLLEVLCQRIRWTADQFEQYTFYDLSVRLAKKLIYLADTFGKPAPRGVRIDLCLSQEMLAGMVGATREAVNRQLSEWASAGLVETRRGEITLFDVPGLSRIADPQLHRAGVADVLVPYLLPMQPN